MSKTKKIISLILNAMRNINLLNLSSKTKLLYLNSDSFSESSLRASFVSNQSPLRNVSNLFWSKIKFDILVKHLESPIVGLEIGCGTGRYSNYITKNGDENTYIGIDILQSRHWEDYIKPNVRFYQDSYLNVTKYLRNVNFVFTQSAIEHFENDLEFFQMIDNYFHASKAPSIVVHLIPPSSALYSYLWHGYRQYPLRAVNRLLNSSRASNFIIPLGGAKTNKVHRHYITYPTLFLKQDLRNTNSIEYLTSLITAVKQDSKNPKIKSATYLVIVQVYNLNLGLDVYEFLGSQMESLEL